MKQNLLDIFNNLERHCGKWNNYFPIYERHFSQYVGKSPVVVEVGICRGGSAEMWQKYFGEGATIIGIDIDPVAFKPEHQTPGCIQVRGDQGDPKFWETFLETYPDIDIFLDDGSHHAAHQITTLESVWHSINHGGTYMIEDCHTSYWANYGGGLNKTGTIMQYAKAISDTMNAEHYRDGDRTEVAMQLAEYYDELVGMHLYDSVIVLDKAAKTTMVNLLSTPV